MRKMERGRKRERKEGVMMPQQFHDRPVFHYRRSHHGPSLRFLFVLVAVPIAQIHGASVERMFGCCSQYENHPKYSLEAAE